MEISFRQIGIVLVVIGTIFLAFSVKVKRGYEDEPAKIVDNSKVEKGLIEPTETSIVRGRFWIGLSLIGLGSLLQW